jgi:DNA-directed RNA polymerase beta subunit
MNTPKKDVKASAVRETCPSFTRANFSSPEKIQKFRFLSEPHVESFNYFLTVGLPKAVLDMEPIELDLIDWKQQPTTTTTTTSEKMKSTVETLKFWFENVKIQPPSKQGCGTSQVLYPRECRELGIMYSGSHIRIRTIQVLLAIELCPG